MTRTLITSCLIALTIAWPVGTCGAMIHAHGDLGAHLHALNQIDVHDQHGRHHDHEEEDREGERDRSNSPQVMILQAPPMHWEISLSLPEGVSSQATSVPCLEHSPLPSIWHIVLNPRPPACEVSLRQIDRHVQRHPREGSSARIARLMMTSHAILL